MTERVVVLAGRAVPYAVRRSPRATRLRLRLTAARGLEVVAPPRGRLPDLDRLLRESAGWIIAALDRYPPVAGPRALASGDAVPYQGIAHQLVVVANGCERTRVARDGAARTITVSLARGEAGAPSAWLESWYRAEARTLIEERARYYADALGVGYERLALRDQRTRWGSCSARGNLNFNWRLILAPPAVLDYVVIHELAHRRELNHSARFWALVEAHCPDYRAHRAWLNEHGTELMALLPRATGDH